MAPRSHPSVTGPPAAGLATEAASAQLLRSRAGHNEGQGGGRTSRPPELREAPLRNCASPSLRGGQRAGFAGQGRSPGGGDREEPLLLKEEGREEEKQGGSVRFCEAKFRGEKSTIFQKRAVAGRVVAVAQVRDKSSALVPVAGRFKAGSALPSSRSAAVSRTSLPT